MLVLQTFPPFKGTLCASPFGSKADALLQMSGLPFTRQYADVRKAPRHKLPVLVDGDTVVPDSAHIQSHLETAHGVDFDGELSPGQRGLAVAIRRMVEEHLYFIGGHLRWNHHPGEVREAFFKDVPGLMRKPVFAMVKRNLDKRFDAQGLGRHTPEQVLAKAYEDVDAIAALLGDKPFMLGERPTSVDASVWGCLQNVLECTLALPLKDHAATHANLVAYVARFREQVYDDDWPL